MGIYGRTGIEEKRKLRELNESYRGKRKASKKNAKVRKYE